MNPLLTIITINYNDSAGLQKTIDSVKNQNYKPIEFIIIDGGSNDGSKEVIERNASIITYWVSEKDNGIYNAMNKGIQKATGAYLFFLNSGDYLYSPDSLKLLLAGNNNEDIIYGDIFMQEKNGVWLKEHSPILTFEYFLKDNLGHQSTVIKRALFEKVGLYNEEYKIVADWDFFIRAICLYSAFCKYVNIPISFFYRDGISSDPANNDLANKEKERTLLYNFSAFLPDYKKLDQYRSDLNNIMNSRLHKLLDKALKSSFYKKVKR
jgi:glycosyltransferase involved in cell wall biosynthesis